MYTYFAHTTSRIVRGRERQNKQTSHNRAIIVIQFLIRRRLIVPVIFHYDCVGKRSAFVTNSSAGFFRRMPLKENTSISWWVLAVACILGLVTCWVRVLVPLTLLRKLTIGFKSIKSHIVISQNAITSKFESMPLMAGACNNGC